MKKLVAIVVMIAISMVFFAVPAYANDYDVPVDPIDIDENIVYGSSGKAIVYCFFSTGEVAVIITVRGNTTLDYNGDVSDFDCLYCTVETRVIEGHVPDDFAVNAHYVDYSVVNDTVRARVYYTVAGDDVINGNYIYATMPGL